MASNFFPHSLVAFIITTASLWIPCAPALAAVGDPAGNEFQVNTYTLAHQQHASVAMNAAGGFVVVWESSIQGLNDFSSIYAQRYDAAGAAVGGEIQVNSTEGEDHQFPKVAMNATGQFVVVWESIDQDGNLHVYDRRFDATGTALGSDQAVPTTAISLSTFSTNPTVAMDASGNYVVAWENFDDVNGDEDIYARRFDASGVASGADFTVNATLTNDQASPALAMNSGGDFVITWQSMAQDGDGNGIYAQLYAAAGTVLKGEFLVNSVTSGDQTLPAAAMSADGFIVAWQSQGQDGDGNGIYARHYDVLGTELGNEFQVNTTTTGDQTAPAAAMNADGFVVAWESLGQDGDAKGIFGQRYDTSGASLGGEFQVNTTTAKDQALPTVALNADNASVVAWQSYGQDGSWYGIFAQRYLGNTVASDAGSSSGGGGAFGLLSSIVIIPLLLRRRRNPFTLR